MDKLKNISEAKKSELIRREERIASKESEIISSINEFNGVSKEFRIIMDKESKIVETKKLALEQQEGRVKTGFLSIEGLKTKYIEGIESAKKELASLIKLSNKIDKEKDEIIILKKDLKKEVSSYKRKEEGINAKELYVDTQNKKLSGIRKDLDTRKETVNNKISKVTLMKIDIDKKLKELIDREKNLKNIKVSIDSEKESILKNKQDIEKRELKLKNKKQDMDKQEEKIRERHRKLQKLRKDISELKKGG